MNPPTGGSHLLPGARKDEQIITSDWQKIDEGLEGVHVHEVRHVPRDHGVITEVFRPEWDPTGMPVVHVYQSRLFPGAIGAWSCHMKTVDRLFKEAESAPGYRLAIDLEDQSITTPSGETLKFEIDPFRKHCLVNGLDEIGLTLQHADEIRAFETKRRQQQPWLFAE